MWQRNLSHRLWLQNLIEIEILDNTRQHYFTKMNYFYDIWTDVLLALKYISSIIFFLINLERNIDIKAVTPIMRFIITSPCHSFIY